MKCSRSMCVGGGVLELCYVTSFLGKKRGKGQNKEREEKKMQGGMS